MAKLLRLAAFALFLITAASPLAADARFDLTGPPIAIYVTRAGMSLPIDAVPNLQAGDKLWLQPKLPSTQSVRYLLIVAFLRGTTNPPPDNWFIRIQTWDKKVRAEGATVIVPDEAQQVILFLAPVTGGDFSTLRSAVQGRPGVFVRASQDLIEAGFEQARIEKYIASLKQAPPSDPKALLEHSNLLAATLSLKPNEDCFRRIADQQSTCLMQSGNQMLLNDGHAQSVAAALANGPNSDLISAASFTQLGGAGLYSAYVGAVVDLVRVLSGLHTAHYQYIPAIAFPQKENLNLRLNTPPSFHDPKSVIVIGLPAVQATTPPPLRPANDKEVTCLLKPKAALLVTGAPLVFSTGYAHDLKLHLNTPQPTPDLSLVADPYQGGLVVTPASKRRELSAVDSPQPASATSTTSLAGAPLTGTISGYWGFDRFTGPTMLLQNEPGKDWKILSSDPLIAGHDEHIQITSTATGCIQSISAGTQADKPIKADWKRSADSNKVDVTLALHGTPPAGLQLSIKQFGEPRAETISTRTFSEPSHLQSLTFHAGDSTAVLHGEQLDQVKQVDLKGTAFMPQPAPNQESGTLNLAAASPSPLHVGEKVTAKVELKDGRTLPLVTTVAPARPSITLLGRTVQPSTSPIQLAGKDDQPLDQPFSFSLHSDAPFPRKQQVEIASLDGSLHATLSLDAGALVLQDAHTILANFDALKVFGHSAFGPLRLRAVASDGSTGDWLPLATLVRLPTLNTLQCPADKTQPCTLTGSNLYLIDAASATPDFSFPTTVPEGFLGNSLSVPHPIDENGVLYLRLRDDPTNANTVTLPIQPQ